MTGKLLRGDFRNHSKTQKVLLFALEPYEIEILTIVEEIRNSLEIVNQNPTNLHSVITFLCSS